MVSRWSEIKKRIKEKRYPLHSLGVGSIFFAVLYLLTKNLHVSLCPIKYATGKNCPGCGLTRGFMAILESDPVAALEYNVLSLPIFTGIVLYCFFVLIDILFGKNYIGIIEKQLSEKYMFIIYMLILSVSCFLNSIV